MGKVPLMQPQVIVKMAQKRNFVQTFFIALERSLKMTISLLWKNFCLREGLTVEYGLMHEYTLRHKLLVLK